MLNRRRQDLCRLFRFGIVVKGDGILMRGRSALFLFGLGLSDSLRHVGEKELSDEAKLSTCSVVKWDDETNGRRRRLSDAATYT